jgi:hypothetical protein
MPGFDGGTYRKTLDQVGNTMGVTREWVRVLERDGLRKMKHNLNALDKNKPMRLYWPQGKTDLQALLSLFYDILETPAAEEGMSDKQIAKRRKEKRSNLIYCASVILDLKGYLPTRVAEILMRHGVPAKVCFETLSN